MPGQSNAPFRAALVLAVVGALAVAGLASPSPAGAAPPETIVGRASTSSDGVGGNRPSGRAFTEKYGRFVGFTSSATNLVPGVTTEVDRVYLKDRMTDRVELISRFANGNPASAGSTGGAVTPDGRFVVFATFSPLVETDTNGSTADVYVRDRWTGALEMVSVSSAEVVGDGASGSPASLPRFDISDDGRYVAFSSDATNLVLGDTNSTRDVFRRDRQAGTTAMVSINAAQKGNAISTDPTMSADGRYVAFRTLATNLIANDTNGKSDVLRRDMSSLDMTRVSVGSVVNPNGDAASASMSDDGTKVAFVSSATDLVPNDTNSVPDVFLRTISGSTTTRVSVATGGTQLNGGSSSPSIRPNGTGVAYRSSATNAVAGDTNNAGDVFETASGTTTRLSVYPDGAQADNYSDDPVASNETVVWTTPESYSALDAGSLTDVYVRAALFIGVHPSLEHFLTRQLTGFTGAAPAASVDSRAQRVRDGGFPARVVTDLALAPSFSGSRAKVIRLYWAYFKRRPDLSGLTFWLNKYATGTTLNQISQKFAQSPEFAATYGDTTNSDFVKLVYQNVLDRAPDAPGVAFWVAKLGSGLTRGGLMVQFSESAEGRAHIAPPVDTTLIALGMYGQIPSKLLFDAVVDAIANQHQPTEIAVVYILGSPEYQTTVI